MNEFLSKYDINTPIASYEEESENVGQSWNERQESIDVDWGDGREERFDETLELSAFFKMDCQMCKRHCDLNVLVRCFSSSCNKVLCHECDIKFHGDHPFHNRWMTSEIDWKPLSAMEFISGNGVIHKRGETREISKITYLICFILKCRCPSALLSPGNLSKLWICWNS